MHIPENMREGWIAKYWDSATLYKPSIECLIDHLVVKEVLIDEKKEPVYKVTCMYKSLVEFDDEYIQLMNKVYNASNYD